MTFTTKTLTTLEYDKIIEMLVECTVTEGAKARARALMPTDEYDFVVDRQNKTDDAKRLINAKQMLSSGIKPTTAAIHCGFNDYAGFYRAFTAEYGITPKEYVMKS